MPETRPRDDSGSRALNEPSQEGQPESRHQHGALRVIPEVAVLVVCAVLFWQTAGFDGSTNNGGPGPAFFPRVLIGLLTLAMLVRIVQQLREVRRASAESDEENVSSIRLLQAIALAVGYVAATVYLGWVIATFCFVIAFLYVAGKRRLRITVPLAAGLVLSCVYVFVKVVYIPLPTGIGMFDVITVRFLELIGVF